ncbi:DUF2161 domain-containing phosphodiesterase [Profundibacter amoris]|uniref:Uncharacterized protein n=1 Tax=Profundibacter amoris TaxID=2171755 RepID=A0A347UIW7_9RHOB|nr:DUF2161 family putative PD-(D/E)XK-type phosphodiesterase [Profundibacter amoris]AXX98795.1 hypothetical protein BAR1_13200 [Profundibacter amoris]
MAKPRETDLYPPVKTYLEGQGYEVKGEVGAVDVMAVRGQEDPVLVELKLGFSLALLHQGIARQGVSDAVYLAVPYGLKGMKENLSLCRRLGLGLMTVRLRDGYVEVLADPSPYRPRKVPARKTRLLREFARRVGDPNAGGATRVGIITSYRQDALRCATFLENEGASKGAVVARGAGVPKATRIMADDHYGWFERVEKGIYMLTPKGVQALANYGRVAPLKPVNTGQGVT